MATLQIRPDRWIMTTRGIYDALSRAWLSTVPADSLLALRVRCGLIQYDAHTAIGDQIVHLAAAGSGTLHIVVERIDETTAQLAAALAATPADIRLHAWRTAPLDVVETAAAPEEALLAEWRRLRAMPVDVTFSPAGIHPEWTVPVYLRALRVWEGLARAEHPALMAELYDPSATLGDWLRQSSADEFVKEPWAEFDLASEAVSNEGSHVWFTKDRSAKLHARIDEVNNQLVVNLTLGCGAQQADGLERIELCLDNEMDLLLAGSGMRAEWRDIDGGAAATTMLPVDAETRDLLTRQVVATVRIRKGD